MCRIPLVRLIDILHCLLQLLFVASLTMTKSKIGRMLPVTAPWMSNTHKGRLFHNELVYAVYIGDEILERALPLVYWGRRGNDLLGLIQWMFQAVLGDGWFCSLALALADVAFWTAVAGVLHRRRWYLKV